MTNVILKSLALTLVLVSPIQAQELGPKDIDFFSYGAGICMANESNKDKIKRSVDPEKYNNNKYHQKVLNKCILQVLSGTPFTSRKKETTKSMIDKTLKYRDTLLQVNKKLLMEAANAGSI